jgi:hypothetical protein
MKIKGFVIRWTPSVLIGATFIYLSEVLPKNKIAWDFLTSNSIGLILSLVLFIILCIWTYMNYFKTLGNFEEETEESGIASKQNGKVWSVFWLAWSLYCSIITIKNNSIDWEILLISSILSIAPGFLAFLFARRIRNIQLKENLKDKERLGEKYVDSEPYYIYTEWKYFSGYYGLICIPIFIIITTLGILLKNIL